MRTLALIDDDVARARALRAGLEAEGFRVEWFGDARAGAATLQARSYALLLVEVDAKGIDPYELCLGASAQQPVIAIASDMDPETRIRALESGADDCVTYPVNARELGLRIQNILRRTGVADDELLAVEVFVDTMQVRVGGETRDLSRGEAEVLAVLVDHAPAPLTIARIMEMLPPEASVKRGTIESRIKSLRRKLGPDRLVSRGRLGYQIVE